MAKKRSTTASTRNKTKKKSSARKPKTAARKAAPAKKGKKKTRKTVAAKGAKRTTARSPKRKAAPRKKPAARRKAPKARAEMLAGPPPSIQINTINGGPPGSMIYSRNQDLIVVGSASEDFTHVAGAINPSPLPPPTFPHSSRAGTSTTWSLTWLKNSVQNPGLHVLHAVLDNQLASDSVNITFS
jgi:hypothetical protein